MFACGQGESSLHAGICLACPCCMYHCHMITPKTHPAMSWSKLVTNQEGSLAIKAATGSRMLEYPHTWQVLGYNFSYPNIRPQKKKKKKKKKSRPTLTRARESGVCWHGTVGKNVSQLKHCQTHPFRNWDQMSKFLFGLGGKWIILPSLVFKTALFTVIILIKSAPATQSKIACVFSEGSEKLLSGMVVAKKKKIQKNQKIKKFKKKSKKLKKIKKNIKKTWRPNIRVFACEPGSVLGYLITLLCTALLAMWVEFDTSINYRLVTARAHTVQWESRSHVLSICVYAHVQCIGRRCYEVCVYDVLRFVRR